MEKDKNDLYIPTKKNLMFYAQRENIMIWKNKTIEKIYAQIIFSNIIYCWVVIIIYDNNLKLIKLFLIYI